ncbi:hypothetical protein VTN31DRAFT_3620 [Thermomyces dupontii]|uniref:uncharacterized protein n=1 Tax=Talaromyces thermophilus TaxID=28565 RepID=UPI0037423AAE
MRSTYSNLLTYIVVAVRVQGKEYPVLIAVIEVMILQSIMTIELTTKETERATGCRVDLDDAPSKQPK